MRLGYHTGYWAAGPPAGITDAIAACERLGFDSIWTAEAYGSDCLTPLAWWGASTSRVRLGTNIMQLSARTPAAAAMAAMTLDHLSGGRFVLGLGASGPQVVEGWYGQPYPKPLARTREYVEVVRAILARDVPVTHEGEFYPLPYPGGSGLGKPLKSTVHPLRTDIPIMLGAEGPKNVALAAEIADGWLPMFFHPERAREVWGASLEAGLAKRAPELGSLDVFASPALAITDRADAAAAAIAAVKPNLALYVGGMGARGKNFYNDLVASYGYAEDAATIQDLYLAGRRDEAVAAVPDELVRAISLIGSPSEVAERIGAFATAGVTTLTVTPLARNSVERVALMAGLRRLVG